MSGNASPPIALLSLMVTFAMLAIFFGGIRFWSLIFLRRQRNEEIIPFAPRRPVPWGFFDLLMGMLIFIVITIACVLAIKQIFGYDLTAAENMDNMRIKLMLMMLDSVGRMVALGLLAVLIMLRTHGTLSDLGWSWSHVKEDIILGGQAFMVLALPVFAIQILLVQIWPSEHPLVESLKKEQDLPFVFMAIFMAVISAPLAEEFFFRTLLQGWLEKMFDPLAAQQDNFGNSLLFGEQVSNAPPDEPIYEAVLVEPITPIATTENPYAPPIVVGKSGESSLADYVPLFISAFVFALLHVTNGGPDWVALFILALGLGYLYRRTHRMLPGIVVHFLLNSLSMCSLLIQLFQPAAK